MTKNNKYLQNVTFSYFPVTRCKKGGKWSFRTHIQINNSKLKLVPSFYFPVPCCKKGGGWSFRAYIYNEIVQD